MPLHPLFKQFIVTQTQENVNVIRRHFLYFCKLLPIFCKLCLLAQRFSVNFAVWCQWHTVKPQAKRWYHIPRQIALQQRQKRIRFDRTRIEQHDLLFFRIVKTARAHHTLVLHCGGFDLAKLNAVSLVLDLRILAANKDQFSVYIAITKVSRAVNRFGIVGVERILSGDEYR